MPKHNELDDTDDRPRKVFKLRHPLPPQLDDDVVGVQPLQVIAAESMLVDWLTHAAATDDIEAYPPLADHVTKPSVVKSMLQVIANADDDLLELARAHVNKILKERPNIDIYRLYQGQSVWSTLFRKLIERSQDEALMLRVTVTGKRVRHPQGDHIDIAKVAEHHPDQMKDLVIEENRETIDSFVAVNDGRDYWTKVVETSENLVPEADVRVAEGIEARANVIAIINGALHTLSVRLQRHHWRWYVGTPKNYEHFQIEFVSRFDEDEDVDDWSSGFPTSPVYLVSPEYRLIVYCPFCNTKHMDSMSHTHIYDDDRNKLYEKYCKITDVSMIEKESLKDLYRRPEYGVFSWEEDGFSAALLDMVKRHV